MYRGNNEDRLSAKHNTSAIVVTATIEGEKQKQKKRLSFKEPEIETQHNFTHNPLSSTAKHSSLAKDRNFHQIRAESLEDLTLEDQALQIAKSVGQAFINPSRDSTIFEKTSAAIKTKPATKTLTSEKQTKEKAIEEARPKDKKVNFKPDEQPSQKILTPLLPVGMRCPVIQVADEDDGKIAEEREERNGGAREVECSSLKNAGFDSGWPTGARHQIQLLNLQLVQQRQQTQTAMSQIQLLKDQLEAESSARYQAQVQNQQLMNQNKELVNQIQQLFQQIQDLEKQIENYKSSNQPKIQAQESKQETLAAPGPNQYGYRRNSASLWSSTLNPILGLMGRRNSATLSPAFQQESSGSNNQPINETSGRRPSTIDDPSTASSFSKFGSSTDWKLRRRGCSNFNLDFPSKNRISNSSNEFNAIEDPILSPEESTKTALLFPSESRVGTTQLVKPKPGLNSDSKSHSSRSESLIINESSYDDDSTKSGLWSERNFKPIASEDQCPPSYAKRPNNRERTSDNQSKLTKSFETLRLFNS